MGSLAKRGIDRLVIVLIGGAAIYLAYRLPLAVEAEGEALPCPSPSWAA